jgi:putative transposase
VRRVEDIMETLWGTRVSSGTVSRLNQKIYRHIEAWRNRQIEGEYPYVYLDGVVLKRSLSGRGSCRCWWPLGWAPMGIARSWEGEKEDLEGWRGFLRHLKDCGLVGIKLIISDACRGLVEAAAELFPQAQWQHCIVHSIAMCSAMCPTGRSLRSRAKLLAMHAQEDRTAAEGKAKAITTKLKTMRRPLSL